MAQPYQQPNYNSDGEQVWNPTVGRYFEPAKNQRESYGGIVGALQDQLFRETGVAKSYPHNFAGIIAAIEDLTFTQKEPPVSPDTKPPGGEAVPDGEGGYDWIWIEQPANGSLWFDERQGRLFIAIDGDYYQTNGADGLAQVTTADQPTPESPVVGQFWWDSVNKVLYIFDGYWFNQDGEIKDNYQPGYTPVWRVVTEDGTDGGTITTATLPLDQQTRNIVSPAGNILPDIAPGSMNVQKNYNEWLFAAVESLETAIESEEYSAPIEMGEVPPANPEAGDLWYDVSTLELSIYYSGQWVPTSVTYTYDNQITALNNQIITEQSTRASAISALDTKIDGLIPASTTIQTIQQTLGAIGADLASRPTIDPAQFATTGAADALGTRISALETASPDYALLMPRAEIESDLDAQQAGIAALPTQPELDAVAAAIPDVSSFITQQNVTDAINNITVDYLPRDGGVINGSFKIEKTAYDEPAFDLSGSSWHSAQAFKFISNGNIPATTTFGTTTKSWEYAWNFSANEDFCWVYDDSNKVFSITKDGPACSTLYVGDINPNDENGRVMFNKIDVKQRLVTYQTTFEQLRQSVANATDFDSLRANILSALANV